MPTNKTKPTKSKSPPKKAAISVNVDDLIREVKAHIAQFTVPATDVHIQLDATVSDDSGEFDLVVSYDVDIKGTGLEADVTWIRVFYDKNSGLWKPQFKLETPRLLQKDSSVDDVEGLCKVMATAHRVNMFVERLHAALSELIGLVAMLNKRFRD